MHIGATRKDRIAEMVRTIEAECALTTRYTGLDFLRPEVLAAMAKVPRDEFVPADIRSQAFDNCALPIGNGQTISQPFIVALMTDLLEPEKNDVILEIGTGSGYQSAVLAELVHHVYSLEIITELAAEAAARLRRLGYDNVDVLATDGYQGWSAHAPFDGVIVTAAATHVPPPLTEQLRPGGRLVIPIGLPYMHQELMVVEKDINGQCHTRAVLAVSFVPFTGRGERCGSDLPP